MFVIKICICLAGRGSQLPGIQFVAIDSAVLGPLSLFPYNEKNRDTCTYSDVVMRTSGRIRLLELELSKPLRDLTSG